MMRLFAAALIIACLASAIAITDIHHLHRKRFVDLTKEERARDALVIELGRLQLEQATWSQSTRIEGIAQRRLAMTPPQTMQIVVVHP